ncbi:uncharacterized protein BO96DRAFT_466593 [Aspergillus niger CBS 101883]|uniref:Uncharacterized protein n=3 Tax=Aspergillus niger TaxID=5061 RepID=A2R9V4_ASPNC|nr:uncharacterized protein BO96DRAFT_466593 [Aspergillus niger CBS 101883]XP_059602863.1 hypothetical protein An18g00340 [Aspergillus niger]PYH55753.1 hypothetical protein BO96DRAFT_466593 [Aspergillus niger CBS 101883]RDH14475.1 hypothetical protein M747DRAFT_319528 [Aspergillus niger ATCC 13496]CAK43110.1 hypothetical protein An18g00340 [Aspergillus niger]
MVERFSIEQISASSRQKSGMSKTKTLLFTILITLLSLCTAAALIVASIAMKKTQELEDFRSSLFISDLERIFNSTAYAIANSGPDAPACHDYTAETITGQTTLPGICVSVEESYNMWVTRLADNCTPYIFAEENCTGVSRGFEKIATPTCIVAAGGGRLSGQDRPSEAARHEEKWEEVAADTDLSLKRYEGKFDRADKSISYFYRLSVLHLLIIDYYWPAVILKIVVSVSDKTAS